MYSVHKDFHPKKLLAPQIIVLGKNICAAKNFFWKSYLHRKQLFLGKIICAANNHKKIFWGKLFAPQITFFGKYYLRRKYYNICGKIICAANEVFWKKVICAANEVLWKKLFAQLKRFFGKSYLLRK